MTVVDRTSHYREEAMKLRAEATLARSPFAREQLLDLAQLYEHLAEHAEHAGEQRGDRDHPDDDEDRAPPPSRPTPPPRLHHARPGSGSGRK